MRLLVTGGAGMLGQAVAAAATRLGHDVVALSRAELDVTDADHVRRVIAAAEPRAVVNCAAWTDVDGAETAEAAATAVNGDGAGNVARAAAETGARIVHVSTDYVFDGERAHAGGGTGEPWVESDAVNPLGAYGRSKLAGEQQVAAATDEHAIVRTAWLFGAGGRNFVDTMLALGEERDEVSVVTDQVGSPTWTVHLAEGLVELAERSGDVGILHATGGGACSWYELAVEVFDRAGLRCRVLPTTSDRFPRPARRPAYSVLGTERDEAPVLPAWQEGVAVYLSEKAVVAR
jgi:dTDP-4-dehydrorhamnose reductase